MMVRCPNCESIFDIDDAEDYWEIQTGYHYECPKCNYVGESNDYEEIME